MAVAGATSFRETADLVVGECQTALEADAVCVYWLLPDKHYKMVSQTGCTDAFIEQWSVIPEENPFIAEQPNPSDFHFFSDREFHDAFPNMQQLLAQAGRKSLIIAPMVINLKPVGILAYSYNRPRKRPGDMTFLITLIHLCSLALERSRLFECELAARRQAEEANRAKTHFLANVSHEIRSPIGIIQGFSDMLSGSANLNEQQSRWLSTIRNATRQLGGIIGEVLDVSKIEAGKIEIDVTPFHLVNLLEEVETIARFKAKDTAVDLQFQCNDLPVMVKSDPLRMKQVINNLIGNALKFTKEGHVKVDIKYHRTGRLDITVEDTGIGIPSTYHARIFEPFTQADSSTERTYGGTGLGLSIARGLARQLGGDVRLLRSVPGEGTKFLFTLDCGMVDQESRAFDWQNGVRSASDTLKGLRILLVDDSQDNLEMIGLSLSNHGAEITSSTSGGEALEIVSKKSFDLVIMDIQMPGLDGRQTMLRLRNSGYRKPIAALTANAVRVSQEHSQPQGFDAHWTKPIDFPRLVLAIKLLVHPYCPAH